MESLESKKRKLETSEESGTEEEHDYHIEGKCIVAENIRQIPPEILKDIILDLQEPIVFNKTFLKARDGTNVWKILDWSVQDFSEKMGDSQLSFRIGINGKTESPQWEVDCSVEEKTMRKFLEDIENDKDRSKWFYFDYKHMNEWCKDKPEILKSINWQHFGFDLDGSDSTLWIGSKGSHSLCHQDTYGCNLIAQVQGRKRWILFPPECGPLLKPTRVPYEESTIYSKFNFFSLCAEEKEEFKRITGGKTVVLEPGEVLLVPSGWWHYVESLDTSISVNVWLPLNTDCKARLKEALVKIVVDRLGEQIPRSLDQPQFELFDCLNFLKQSLDECKNVQKPTQNEENKEKWTVKRIEEKFSNIMTPLQNINGPEIAMLQDENRFPSNMKKLSKTTKKSKETDDILNGKLCNAVIDAFCQPAVISMVAEILAKECK